MTDYIGMYVCNCEGVTENQIRAAAEQGHTSVRALKQCLGVAAQCGKCAQHAKAVIDQCESNVVQLDDRRLSA